MLEDIHKPCKELIGPLRVNIRVAQFWMLSEEIGESQEEALQLQGYNLISHTTVISSEEMLQDVEHRSDNIRYHLLLPGKPVVS